jgi:hypothetical protein
MYKLCSPFVWPDGDSTHELPHHLGVCVVLITENLTLTAECGAAMEVLFLCFGLCVGVQLDSLSYSSITNAY